MCRRVQPSAVRNNIDVNDRASTGYAHHSLHKGATARAFFERENQTHVPSIPCGMQDDHVQFFPPAIDFLHIYKSILNLHKEG